MSELTTHPAPLAEQMTGVRAELDQVKQELTALLAGQPAPDPNLFQPGRTYALFHGRFQCEHVTTDPNTGEHVAWGWSTFNAGKAPWAHRQMTTQDFRRWMTSGGTDLGWTTTTGEPR